jgi:TRAP-type C4-dicarboxylate transport system permease small subunit
LPITSWKRGQIYVDSFIAKLPVRGRNAFNGATRAMGIVLFVLIGWNLLLYGADLQRSGEVSLTLQLPFYPVVYAVGVCSFFEALVLACDFVKIAGGRYE